MFYWLFYEVLYPEVSFFRVFKYITVRAGGAMLFSIILVLVLTPLLINYLKKKEFYERVKAQYLENHIHKERIPTMGGLILLFSIILTTLLWARLDNRLVIFILLVTIAFGILGFLDDYLKVIKNRALIIKEKLLCQILIGLFIGGYLFLYPFSSNHTSVYIPFTKGLYFDFWVFYILFATIIIVASSNAVNLTDGLDGLAIGSCVFVCLGLVVIAYIASNIKFSTHLKLSYVPQACELVVYLGALLGSALGFLWYNAHPAQIFMGDTGSITLGGALGVSAIVIKQEIPFLILGGLFVLEAGSVLIQIISYKLFGRRIFLIAPLHHHFEKEGWPEEKIVIRFWIIAIICVLFSFTTLKIR